MPTPRWAGPDVLVSLGESLYVGGNDSLTSLTGLDGLALIGLDLAIADNARLTDVVPLYGLTLVGGDVDIVNNVVLSDASAQDLVDEIDAIGGTVTVSGNN